jgi:putative methionine-R-sulfoxide reductase with GAF domain
MTPKRRGRDYDRAAAEVSANGSPAERMQSVVDVLWHHLSPAGVSWVGFYVWSPDAEQLVLGPCRDKPACSPIGMHGACGQAFRRQQALVVRDVRELGENYVACDPRDQSEVVICIFNEDGTSWGVLDLDSHDLAAFDEQDVAGLQNVLERAGFRTRR